MHESDRRWRNIYNRIAVFYDWSVRLTPLLLRFRDAAERRKMVGLLELKPGDRVLEVGVGTGNNLQFLAEAVGAGGRLAGLDISSGMLRQCRRKVQRQGVKADLVEGEAAHLPFADNCFDAVLHFGGINGFGDRQRAIAEMIRVARPGARIVMGDEGLRRDSRSAKLLRLNPLYAHDPPLALVPPEARDLHLEWFRGDACYLICFAKP